MKSLSERGLGVGDMVADDEDFYDDDKEPDPGEIRQVLRQVSAYRDICRQIRNKASGTIFFGLFMLGIWYFTFGKAEDWSIFSILYLSLGLLEISVGILNRFWPSPEGILLDGVVLFGFALSNLVRTYLAFQLVGQRGLNPVSIVFAVFWFFQGIQVIRSYIQIKRVMPVSPTGEHLRWFDGLVRELRDADPKLDERSLALPTAPFLTARLLGDHAFFLEPGGSVIIAGRNDVEIERLEQSEFGMLTMLGTPYPPFKLSDANWQNYVNWKREGGEDPLAVPTVYPVRA